MTDSTLPPCCHEYTQANVVPGYGATAGLYTVELIGHAHCWTSGHAWADPVMAKRAGNRLLARSQRSVGA